MSMPNNGGVPTITNPLQNNNAAVMMVGYLAGIAAAKLPWFDFATWNYIIFTVAGVAMTAITYIINRKSVVVSTVANMAEVKNKDGIVLDKTVPGAVELAKATPSNVVAN